jgi:hypothetical protein
VPVDFHYLGPIINVFARFGYTTKWLFGLLPKARPVYLFLGGLGYHSKKPVTSNKATVFGITSAPVRKQ